MPDQLHVHFMGICGSGCAAIAFLAIEAGFRVSGCDQNTESYYAGELKRHGVTIYQGHDRAHLADDVDIVAVSPAIFDVSPDNPELICAKERGILMTWQEFMGTYLQKGKRLTAVAGTHGKTTTTFLLSELLIDAGLDPTVEGGSVYKKWGIGARSGKSDLFVCEADEFNRNFLHYAPETLVLSTVEMDHPEYYTSYEDMLDAYVSFVCDGGKLRTLIANAESAGTMEVVRRCKATLQEKQVRLILTAHEETKLAEEELGIPFETASYHTLKRGEEGSVFRYCFSGHAFEASIRLTGEYNVQNAAGAITAALLLGAAEKDILGALRNFSGVGRRFDYIGSFRSCPVYDDYAHHPTEISSVLQMCRDYYPERKLLAIFEPHQISRLTLMFDGYVNALAIADRVVIWRTHIGREALKGLQPIKAERWTGASEKILYEEDEEKLLQIAEDFVKENPLSMIVVIGAANSYKISRALTEKQ